MISLGLLPVVFVTSTFSGVFGMAGGMMLMAVLLGFYDPVEAIFIQGTIQLFANAQRYFQLKDHVDLLSVRNYACGAVLSYLILNFISFTPSSQLIYILVGLGALLAAFNLRAPFKLRDRWVSVAAGFFVSAMQIAGVVGPVLDIITQDARMSRFEAIGTKAAMVTFSHLLKVIFMGQLMGFKAASELVKIHEILFFLAAAYFGTLLGKRLLTQLSDKNFYKCTSYILFVLSVFYLYKAFV